MAERWESKLPNEVKTRVDFGKVIGDYINPQTGAAMPTTKGIIVNSHTGAHIIPARP
ncbi:polymorphic toxin type 50 domain-containing protein [Parapedobacter sp. DT-150]|uniref:polymorphic toxin type 50 domain-containing protein n=1 Tax=Parapedobacter sp. DT-150 TaxID=3396162 RepID=UPI003F1C611A